MIKLQIKNNAQRIFEYLHEHQISSTADLEQSLHLTQRQVLLALGWLARENKIYFYDDADDFKIIITS